MASPVLPADLRRQALPGTVTARARFVQGVVTRVTVLSGPQVYREPVIEAMKRYSCKGELSFDAEQTFVFEFPPLRPDAVPDAKLRR